jgi:hypothetical protein
VDAVPIVGAAGTVVAVMEPVVDAGPVAVVLVPVILNV